MSRLRDWLSLVRFSHSVFALPFALISALVAAGGLPPWRTTALVCVCAVAARTAAMSFNRLADRDVDAANPRTRARELVRGVLSARAVAMAVVVSSVVFVAAAFALSSLAGWLSLPCLAVVLGYSLTKRVTFLAHAVLGLALALAPLGAWVAVRGDLAGDLAPPLLLAGAVLLWVAGFDLIYSCQDVEFDRTTGLHSLPARFGVARALQVSTALHVGTVLLLLAFAVRADLGPAFFATLVLAAALLVWQHRIVGPEDLSRVDMAFFTLNGWVGLGLFAGCFIDVVAVGGAA